MRGFQKGRRKTGGREKGEPIKANLTNAFKDRLKRYGFNFDKELAISLKLMCKGKPAPQYSELRALLPYTYPKLKEVEPPAEAQPEQSNPISAADLMEALSGKPSEPAKKGSDSLPALETGRTDLQAETDPEGTVPGVAGEQGDE
jgi:hypothetical protein